MLRVASVGSGSKGNATLVASKSTTLLIDCGFPAREMLARLASLDVAVDAIDAVLVTHEHADHIGGVSSIAKAANAPIYATHGTLASGKLAGSRSTIEIESDSQFSVGDIEITAVTVPHDAREPIQFVFQSDSHRVGVLTDLGSVSPHVLRAYMGCDLLLLEFNHDLEMLRRGPYPAALKRRISGDYGHLNNNQAMEMLRAMAGSLPRVIIAGHISEQNNSVDTVSALLAPICEDNSIHAVCASQGQGFDWVSPEPVHSSNVA